MSLKLPMAIGSNSLERALLQAQKSEQVLISSNLSLSVTSYSWNYSCVNLYSGDCTKAYFVTKVDKIPYPPNFLALNYYTLFPEFYSDSIYIYIGEI